MRGHRADLPVGNAGRDHHAVRERRTPGEVERNNLLGLVRLQTFDDDGLHLV